MNKTSIRNINEDVLWDAKIYAAQTKQTMGQVVTEALERLVNDEVEESEIGQRAIDDCSGHQQYKDVR
ncbi:hypothetical protein SLH49_00840 [Cognatiyoonia sp. IB215446]|uniref:hypothetical protein n=1 Tax=Cognatiyoonia sp. IB215446 TaxID=3097355 RepID=UPI002A13AD9B|nr:hypothetical protein [Cognatiyoonia sp. IB215446]MDX8346515.1 hypothetical protein [Cognatiyoonia sp. IB215446]